MLLNPLSTLISLASFLLTANAAAGPVPAPVPDPVAIADPSPVAEPWQTKSAGGTNTAGVYGCNHANWAGGCWFTIASGGACHKWAPSGVGSFGPDKGIACTLFLDDSCGTKKNLKVVNIQTPGIADMSANRDLQLVGLTRPNSYRCHWL